VTYRSARPDDEEALLDLWIDANPGTDRDAWRRTYDWMPDRFARTWVAADPEGTLRSAAVTSVRYVRDATGVPQRVGHLSHVATAQAHRRRGHARRVVELALAAMREDGCAWSSLQTSEEARALYEQLGWRSHSRFSRRGRIAGRPDCPVRYDVHRIDPGAAGGWDAIRRLYDACNSARPLSVVRDDAWWRIQPGRASTDTYAGHWPLLLTAQLPQQNDPCGYLWAFVRDDATIARQFGVDVLFRVVEIAALPAEPAALAALFAALADHLAGRQAAGEIFAPREAEVEGALTSLFGGSGNEVEDTEFMARSLGPAFGDRHLQTMFEAPAGMLWPLDDL
jgi:ribosomal protein S18 acetylase RimI-like enzyme